MARRGTEDEWRKRLARWAKFDGKVGDFCAGEGVSDKSFYVWRKRLAARDAAPAAVEFVEVGQSPRASAVELVVGNAVVRVRGDFEKATLRRVLEVLGERR